MTNYIPKIIHYVWLGGNPIPENLNEYIKTWEKFLPDYEIIEWNESNIDLDKYQYCREAYDAKKYAFASDVVRLDVLYNYGGIYLDTDIEVLKSLDDLLEHRGFSGFESDEEVAAGIIGSEKGGEWVKDQLDYYKTADFVNDKGKYNFKTIVETITEISEEKYGLRKNGELQILKNDFVIYPTDYFYPQSPKTGKITLTENSYAIHHYAGSWVTPKNKLNLKIFTFIEMIFGKKIAEKILKLKN